MTIHMRVVSRNGENTVSFEPNQLVIAGWAGRDQEAMEHHIQELEALGVPRPKETPTFYRVSHSRLCTEPGIEASGGASSGEAEPVIFSMDGVLYAGLGSDHTDRELETHGVAFSKQICDKPISDSVWPYEEVAGHWDQIVLRSYIVENGNTVLYQEGTLDGLLHPADTMTKFRGEADLPDGTVMFCGTMPAIGGIRPAPRFIAELEDPVLSRKIRFEYAIDELPVAG